MLYLLLVLVMTAVIAGILKVVDHFVEKHIGPGAAIAIGFVLSTLVLASVRAVVDDATGPPVYKLPAVQSHYGP